jgi:hypothetical protein
MVARGIGNGRPTGRRARAIELIVRNRVGIERETEQAKGQTGSEKCFHAWSGVGSLQAQAYDLNPGTNKRRGLVIFADQTPLQKLAQRFLFGARTNRWTLLPSRTQ